MIPEGVIVGYGLSVASKKPESLLEYELIVCISNWKMLGIKLQQLRICLHPANLHERFDGKKKLSECASLDEEFANSHLNVDFV